MKILVFRKEELKDLAYEVAHIIFSSLAFRNFLKSKNKEGLILIVNSDGYTSRFLEDTLQGILKREFPDSGAIKLLDQIGETYIYGVFPIPK